MRLNWNLLISDERHKTKATYPSPFRSSFEADYDRIVYSSAFRRLGKKTQVHPMETNAHIHNRLTHSLEVASVGRSFARRLTDFLANQGELPCRCGKCDATATPPVRCIQTADDLAHILMAACLAHDIGNPPFGHAGEFALREWTQKHHEEIFPAGEISDGLKQDVFIFEGNAQGFRLAARDDIPSSGYFELTYSTLAAMVKYPWGSTHRLAQEKKKYNFFSSESAIAADVFGKLGLADQGGNESSYLRHPLSFLSEAADDICYSVVDIEDAVEMQILQPEDAVSLYCELLGDKQKPRHREMPVSMLRGVVVKHLIDDFWSVFEAQYEQIMRGERTEDLKDGLPQELLGAFASVNQMYKRIFGTDKKVRIEIGAYKLLGRIFKAISGATQAYSEHQSLSKIPFIAKRCLELAWDEKFLIAHSDKPYEWWLHEILDFISGLTDDEAYVISNAIAGLGTI